MLLPEKAGPFAFLLPTVPEADGKERPAKVFLSPDLHVCTAVRALHIYTCIWMHACV